MSLEESLHTVKDHMSELSHQVHSGIGVNNSLNVAPEPSQRPALANIADIEDSVDAMGTVVFADEEDCGFFGMAGTFFAKVLRRHLQHLILKTM